MKILILTNLFPTRWDPLRATFNRQQFERLGQHHDVEVMTAVDFRLRWKRTRGNVDIRHVQTDHFVYWYPPGFARSLHALCWLLSLLSQRGRKLRSAHYDCLLVSWAYPDAVAVGWLARQLGIPYVVKVHGSDINEQATHAWRRSQIRRAVQGASAVIAVSQALSDKLEELGVEKNRVHVVYNGIDHARFNPGSRSKARLRLGLSTDAPLLLYVGNLKPTKGCIDLLEAFPALLAAHPRARLIYVGAGPARSALRFRAESMGCASRVQLIGAVAHADMPDWFRATDLVCLPSHNEGVPNVLLEAMACGTPVVASRVGGIPEVVPDYAGIMVPPRSVDALSGALIEAATRPWDHAQIAAHAGQFCWEDNIACMNGILREVITSHAVSASASA